MFAVMHRDTDHEHEHVHIVANRIHLNEDFRLVSDSNERATSMESASDLEDIFELSKAPAQTKHGETAYSHGEVMAAIRDSDIPFKARMIAKIAGAIEQTRAQDGDMFSLVRNLRRQQVYIHLTKNEDGLPKGGGQRLFKADYYGAAVHMIVRWALSESVHCSVEIDEWFPSHADRQRLLEILDTGRPKLSEAGRWQKVEAWLRMQTFS
jgi:hypothetical protein